MEANQNCHILNCSCWTVTNNWIQEEIWLQKKNNLWRQRKLEEAPLFSGQFKVALKLSWTGLIRWRKHSTTRTRSWRSRHCHWAGSAAQELWEDLKNRTKQVKQLKQIAEALGNCREGGCCHDQGPDDWTYKQEEKAKTILNPEKTPQYVKSLKSKEQQNTHILSQRKHTLSHRNKETQGEKILPNWEQKKTIL